MEPWDSTLKWAESGETAGHPPPCPWDHHGECPQNTVTLAEAVIEPELTLMVAVAPLNALAEAVTSPVLVTLTAEGLLDVRSRWP